MCLSSESLYDGYTVTMHSFRWLQSTSIKAPRKASALASAWTPGCGEGSAQPLPPLYVQTQPGCLFFFFLTSWRRGPATWSTLRKICKSTVNPQDIHRMFMIALQIRNHKPTHHVSALMHVHTGCLWACLRNKVPKTCMEDTDTSHGVLANSVTCKSPATHGCFSTSV